MVRGREYFTQPRFDGKDIPEHQRRGKVVGMARTARPIGTLPQIAHRAGPYPSARGHLKVIEPCGRICRPQGIGYHMIDVGLVEARPDGVRQDRDA